ncbi:MAG: acetylglutamate kinase [Alphaproteobacteria bacterium]|jgi:acetylglutamate kinase
MPSKDKSKEKIKNKSQEKLGEKTKLENDKEAEYLNKARILSEALPYMREFNGETFVIKFGGSSMGDDTALKSFARDVVLMKQVGINPIVVHGGGPQIGEMLDKLKISSEFIDGLRVTDEATVEIVEMVLAGKINKNIVSHINDAGGTAIGLCGKDGNLIEARKIRKTRKDPNSNIEKILDLGFVGEPDFINPEILSIFEESDIIPVIAPIGKSKKGETYNINADTVAGAIASALAARKLILLTDVDGVLDKNGKLINKIQASKVKAYIDNGTIKGGMIPKVETCVNALKAHVEAAHIINGTKEHAMLIEIFSDVGVGTMFF